MSVRKSSIVIATTVALSTFMGLADAHAAKRGPFAVSQVVKVDKFTCAIDPTGKWVPGAVNKKQLFETLQLKSQAAKKRAKKKTGKAQQKLLKKAKSLAAQFKAGKKACAAKAPTNIPTPINTPIPPMASCDTMTRYAGAFGEQQAIDILERFGFGVGPAEARLIDIAKTQGLDAFVAAAVTAVTEDQGVIEAVDSMAAGDPVDRTNDAILYHEIVTKNPIHLRVTESLHGMITTGRNVLPADGQGLWYDHFKILRNAALQNKTFSQVVKESATSPMMLYYLDGKDSTRIRPNENFARELQELFSLGVDCPLGGRNYTESRPSGDVLNAARILTGYIVTGSNGNYTSSFSPNLHETAAQTMYAGQPHAFTANTLDGLVDGIFSRHPCAGYFQAQELLKDFISEDPSPALVRAFGDVIRANGFRIMDSMAALMRSEAAFCPAYRDTVTKKPDRVIAEAVRAMDMVNVIKSDPEELVEELAQGSERAGFQIDFPPTVFYYKPQNFRTTASQLEFMNSAGALVETARGAGAALFPIGKLFPPNANATSLDVVRFVAKKLNITLNASQETKLAAYLDTAVDQNGNARRQVFVNTANNQSTKAAIWLIALMLPQVSLS